MISVVIPTIAGREHHLERCLDAYEATTEDYEPIVVPNQPTCGTAWQMGGEAARGDYIHFTADDLVPHPGWAEAAVEVAESGKLPCPLIRRPDGSLESCGQWGTMVPDGAETDIARVPFLTREMWDKGGWVLDAHYYTDNWIWYRGQQLGIPTVVSHGYAFTHYYASEGRLETMERDFLAYRRAVA